MMCQRIGFSPISTMGFGRIALSSVIRVPYPPASMTVFICSPPSYSGSRKRLAGTPLILPADGTPTH